MTILFAVASAATAGARTPALHDSSASLCDPAADTLDVYFSGLSVDTGIDAGAYSSIKDKASASFSKYRWAEAEQYYQNYFSKVLGGSLENIGSLRGSIEYGDALHEYALACLFQGKEEQGLELMDLAAECGSQAAKNQATILDDGAYSRETAQTKEKYKKKFRKYLKKYDFQYTGRTADAEAFWSQMSSTNAQLNILRENLDGDKIPQTLQSALQSLEESRSLIENMLKTDFAPLESGELEENLRTDLLADKKDEIDLRIYENASPNAFTTPYGQVYLTDELVDLYSNRSMLLAVCAHELTHYLCCHSLVHSWESARKTKTNRILGAVTSSLFTIGATTAAIVADENDRSHHKRRSPLYYDAINSSIFLGSVLIYYSFEAGAQNFQFRYSRDQEMEADLMAYRFCEAMGIGGYVYITALQLLGPDYGKMDASKKDDHPTTAFRVAFLQYIYDSEH